MKHVHSISQYIQQCACLNNQNHIHISNLLHRFSGNCFLRGRPSKTAILRLYLPVGHRCFSSLQLISLSLFVVTEILQNGKLQPTLADSLLGLYSKVAPKYFKCVFVTLNFTNMFQLHQVNQRKQSYISLFLFWVCCSLKMFILLSFFCMFCYVVQTKAEYLTFCTNLKGTSHSIQYLFEISFFQHLVLLFKLLYLPLCLTPVPGQYILI